MIGFCLAWLGGRSEALQAPVGAMEPQASPLAVDLRTLEPKWLRRSLRQQCPYKGFPVYPSTLVASQVALPQARKETTVRSCAMRSNAQIKLQFPMHTRRNRSERSRFSLNPILLLGICHVNGPSMNTASDGTLRASAYG